MDNSINVDKLRDDLEVITYDRWDRQKIVKHEEFSWASKLWIMWAIERLPEREKAVIERRYSLASDMPSYDAIGKTFPRVDGGIGVTAVRIRQMCAKGHRLIRKELYKYQREYFPDTPYAVVALHKKYPLFSQTAILHKKSDRIPLGSLEKSCDHEGKSYITEAFALAFPSSVKESDRHMVILQAYFDESGTHGPSDRLVVAGFLSTVEQWQSFETEWNNALAEYGLPFFHMTDYNARVGLYADWTEEMRQARLGRLLDIIGNTVIASYGVSLSKKTFESSFSPRAKRWVGSPYSFAALHCFLLASIDCDTIEGDVQAAYIFEDGAKGKGEILKAYDFLTKIPNGKDVTRVLSLRFEDKRNFVPLQAADILAWELYRDYPNQVSHTQDSQSIPNQRMPFHLFYQLPNRRWKYFSETEISQFAPIVNLLAASIKPNLNS